MLLPEDYTIDNLLYFTQAGCNEVVDKYLDHMVKKYPDARRTGYTMDIVLKHRRLACFVRVTKMCVTGFQGTSYEHVIVYVVRKADDVALPSVIKGAYVIDVTVDVAIKLSYTTLGSDIIKLLTDELQFGVCPALCDTGMELTDLIPKALKGLNVAGSFRALMED